LRDTYEPSARNQRPSESIKGSNTGAIWLNEGIDERPLSEVAYNDGSDAYSENKIQSRR
jgi:hypothetical protein